MSGNPTLLRRTTGETVNLLDASRTPIDHGDMIVLERSQITLKFLVQRVMRGASRRSTKQRAAQADAHDNRAATAIDENPDQE